MNAIQNNHSSQIDKNERTSKGDSFVFGFVGFLILIGIDQAAKYLAFTGSFGNFLNTLKPYIKKFPFFNHNFAFSLPLPPVLMFILYAVILITIVWYIKNNYRYFNTLSKMAWVLILAGAVSNIAERIALDYVRDFIYIFSGIFNLADGYIIAGAIILLITSGKKSNQR
jgi:signal peptidase II